MSDLKDRLEAKEPTMEKVYEIYIRTTPEALWEAITDPVIRSKYTFGAGAFSSWDKGDRVELKAGDRTLADGEVLETDPPRKLVHTMKAMWSEDVAAEGFSRVSWTISPVGDSCHLMIVHDELRDGANDQIFGGWPMIMSGLKTWLESGELLTTPGSLMYAGDASAW